MSGVLNHPTPANMDAWMRSVERRLLTQERRSTEFALGRTMGSGFGKYARQIADWNSEETWLGGQYWSDIGSFNSPDTNVPWIGFTKSAAGLGGVQELVSLDGLLTRWQRAFDYTTGIPNFGAWTSM